MHLSPFGFPAQADGITDDSLNRTATLALTSEYWTKQMLRLEVEPGVFVRHIGDNPDNVSGDQLLGVYGVAALRLPDLQKRLMVQLRKSWGFAPNKVQMHSGRKKTPDFLLFRVLPIIARFEGSWIPRLFADVFTVLNIGSALFPYKAADNTWKLKPKGNTETDSAIHAVNLLYIAMKKKPTILAKLAVWMYAKGRVRAPAEGEDGVETALTYYHSAQFLGNPEVGEVQIKMWRETKKLAGVKEFKF
jgi:hypothetical protein